MTPHKDDLMIRDEWFKDHVAKKEEAEFASGVKVTRLVWKKPGTCCYQIDYILYGGCLMVCGDLGDAVYQWHSQISMSFLSGCDIGYFGGKCQASSSEPKGKDWDREKVQRWIEEQLNQCAADDETPRTPLTYEECVKLMWDEDCVELDEVAGHAHAWAAFIYESKGLIASNRKTEQCKHRSGTVYMDYPRVAFEPCDECSIGYTWDLRTRAHLVGLKMAAEQLETVAQLEKP